MSAMRKFLLVAFALVMTASGIAPASASYTVPDEFMKQDVVVQSISDGVITAMDAHSWVQGSMMPDRITGKGGSNWACTSMEDATCLTKDAMNAILVLAPCSATISSNCIEGLSIGTSPQTLKATTLKFETIGQRIPASSTFKTPLGGGVAVWNSPEMGDYLVLATLNYQKMKSESQPRISDFDVQVIPTKYIQDAGYFAPFSHQTYDGLYPNHFFGNKDPKRLSNLNTANCLIVTDGYCFSRENFAPDTQVKVSLRLPNTVTGWLFGRMKKPDITVTAIDAENNRLEVNAASTVVPNLLGVYPKNQVTSNPSILKWAKSFYYEGDGFLEKSLAASGMWGGLGSGANNFWAFDLWGDLLKDYGGEDKRFTINTRWLFGSTSIGNLNPSCFVNKTQLAGLVTTNAPFYESGPPKLENSILNYKVGGPHFVSDGKTLFSGVYDLNMRSEVARCLYQFSAAPIRAEVSVTSDSGATQDVAVETMSEKNGWIHLGAYNFHFSAPTVKVKFFQDSAPSAAAKPSPTPTSRVTKLSTITCVKGKQTKKITGANPKCPLGYKKK
jgi:hypothetical protein